MPRAGAGLQSGSWRNFAAQPDLEATLRSALAPHGGAVRVVPTPGGATPLCEQVALWAEADQILTPNGAHFVNAIFMREGATLLEGVPWAMRNYTGQLAITRRTLHVHGMCTADAWHVHGMMMCTACALQMHGRRMASCALHHEAHMHAQAHAHAHAPRHSGLRHLRLHSQRPPPTRAFGNLRTRSEEACAAEQDCQHRFRDHAMIYVEPGALRVALADAAAQAPAVGRDANHVVGRGAGRGAGRRAGRGVGRGAERGTGRGAGRADARHASCEDAVGWSNLFGRGCADYSRRGKASAEGVSSPTAGGRVHIYCAYILVYFGYHCGQVGRLAGRWVCRRVGG